MGNTSIKSVKARQILDAKGKPMLEVDVVTAGGVLGRGSAPSGVSAGEHEAYVLRDKDPKWYDGLSVYKAADIVHKTIAPKLKGMDVMDQEAIDRTMIDLDGTPNKSKLGGNTLCSVSLACIRAAAATENVPLYQHLNPARGQDHPLPHRQLHQRRQLPEGLDALPGDHRRPLQGRVHQGGGAHHVPAVRDNARRSSRTTCTARHPRRVASPGGSRPARTRRSPST